MPARPLNDPATESATRLVQALAAREVGTLELCDAAIARIEAGDGEINAVVVRDFERARDQARAADAALARGERRPLLGVPLTVKECFDVAGLPTTWGLEFARRLPPASEDAVPVTRLKAAGAVLLGKTNCAEALADWQTANPVYGRTLNPLDLSRTPGGSSGGGAAALAAGFVPLELGSDLVGSIRVPAHFCGLVGHKPSHALCAKRGLDFPGTPYGSRDDPLAVVGPMARQVADLVLAMDVLAGPEPERAVAWRVALPAPRHAQVGQLRVLVAAQHPGAEVSAHEWLELLDEQARVRLRCTKLFEAIDVVLCPPFGTVAYEHQDERRVLRIDGRDTPYDAQGAWSSLASFAGLPATVVPVARDADGLPIGVQIVGPFLHDRTTLALAGWFESQN